MGGYASVYIGSDLLQCLLQGLFTTTAASYISREPCNDRIHSTVIAILQPYAEVNPYRHTLLCQHIKASKICIAITIYQHAYIATSQNTLVQHNL